MTTPFGQPKVPRSQVKTKTSLPVAGGEKQFQPLNHKKVQVFKRHYINAEGVNNFAKRERSGDSAAGIGRVLRKCHSCSMALLYYSPPL